MSDLKSEITTWLHEQSNWLQESADRILRKGDLKSEDIKELAALLKSEDGQKKSKTRNFQGLTSSGTTGANLRIESIGEVKGIDKLNPRTPLTFGEGNLAVVYGHNGSGKSGYARIFKKICGKPRAIELKSNIFQEPPQEQCCTINYDCNGSKKSSKWSIKDKPLIDLVSVDIFDGDEAGFYLTGETIVSYTPPEVSLFEKLAAACDQIRQEIQAEQDKLISRKPTLPSRFNKTRFGQLYKSLTTSTTKSEFTDLTSWTNKNQETLDQLKERLKESDPKKLALDKGKRKAALDKLLESIKKASTHCETGAIERIQKLKKTAKTKRKIALEGAKAHSKSAMLEGVGSETWRALWEAAKEYSINEAYPAKEFPVTTPNSRCVLCQQELDSDTALRMKDFNDFVKGKLESEAQTAEKKLENAFEKIPEIPDDESLELQCTAAGLDESELAIVKDHWKTIRSKFEEISKSNPEIDVQGLEPPTSLFGTLESLSESTQEQILQHQKDAKEFDREKTENDLVELEAKYWTSQQKEAIEGELKRQKQFAELNLQKGLANSRNISLQAGKISEKAITEAYIDRFNSELIELGAKRIQVELVKTRIERGRTMHKIKLKDVEQQNDSSTAVLSDGERRIVALAAFLADVVGRPDPTPFIFDDPISSLDHDFEWEVAMRLAKLASERQVIVLTHRLSLYGVLEDAEKAIRNSTGASKKNIEQRCIESFSNSTGHPADEQAWTQNTTKANNTLITRLDQAKKFWDSGDSNNYKIHAQAICSDFRKLLERTVEDDLLHEIVKRHRRSVMTQNKLTGLVNIKNEDCEFIDKLMTKYSKYEHSQSNEVPVEVPDEQTLRQDLEELRDWRKNFKMRK